MRTAMVSVAMVVSVLVAAAGPLAAQGYRFDVGINGGGQYYTAIMKSGQLGAGVANAGFQPGWRVGAQLTFWATERLGLQADGSYTDRMMVQGSNQLADTNLWDATGAVLFRPFGVPSDGHALIPYLVAGAGLKLVVPAIEIATTNGPRGALVSPATSNGLGPFFLANHKQLEIRAGLGTELRVSRHTALRVEAGDRVYDTPLFQLTGSPGAYALYPSPNTNSGDIVSEFYVTLGLHLLFGVAPGGHRVVAPKAPPVRTPPPKPAPKPVTPPAQPKPQPKPVTPPAQPKPVTPPPPVETPVSVCAIDPGAPGGTRTLSAMFRPATGDTLVNGTPLAQVVSAVVTAPKTDWYVAGKPLSVTVGRRLYQYVTYGGPRLVSRGDIVMLGTVKGLPVFAARSDIADFWNDWQAAMREASSAELVPFLKAHPALATRFQDVTVLYVPLRPTGCIFQGLQQLEQVQKAGGR